MNAANHHFVITISHQLGCGGSEIGKKLSEILSIPFVDRQILKMVADCLNIPEHDLENRDERLTSFWEAFMRMEAFGSPAYVSEGYPDYPSDKTLIELEKKFIIEIAQKGPAIFLGRGANYFLKDVKPHFSIFVYADLADRIQRVSALQKIPEREARKIIEKNDLERNRYMKPLSRLDWTDAHNYDLCLNTSTAGIDPSIALIRNCVKAILN